MPKIPLFLGRIAVCCSNPKERLFWRSFGDLDEVSWLVHICEVKVELSQISSTSSAHLSRAEGDTDSISSPEAETGLDALQTNRTVLQKLQADKNKD